MYIFLFKPLSEADSKYLSMIINNKHAVIYVIRFVKYFSKPTTIDSERKYKH